jgi:hypothetical protein
VALSRVDFSEAMLNVAGGSFTFEKAVESVEFSDCVYRPSQALPVYGQPLP